MCPSGGESPERPAEPQTDIVGPQRPRSEADEGAKGVMMVDSPPHQPHTKKKNSYYSISTGMRIGEPPAVPFLAVPIWLYQRI